MMKTKKQLPKPSRLALLIASALTPLVTFQTAHAVGTMYANVPLHLQQTTETKGAAGPKPNVMLLIDDSGSMNTLIPNSRDTRIDLTKRVLKDIVSAYRGKLYFGVASLNTLSGDNLRYYEPVVDDNQDYNSVINSINWLVPRGVTPSTKRYYEVAKKLVIPGQKYRCQKSYIVLMSDGDAYANCSPRGYHYANAFGNIWDGYFGHIRQGRCTPEGSSYYNRTFYDSELEGSDGLKNLSHVLATKNFKDYIGRSTDAAGKKWDSLDPRTNTPYTQTAQTFTIGFKAGMSARGLSYLQNGATPDSNSFFAVDSAQDVIDAFQSIFSTIDDQNQNLPISAFSATAPGAALMPSGDVQAIAATLNSGSWSSNLRIYKITKDGVIDRDHWAVPDFDKRVLLVSDGTNVHRVGSGNTPKTWTNTTFNISSTTADNQNEWYDGLLAWYARSKADGSLKKRNYVLDYRVRAEDRADSNQNLGYGERNMGDIIDNPIINIGADIFKRPEFLVTSANDGMVYVFRSQDNANHPYSLVYNYMPMAMQRQSNDASDNVSRYYPDLLSNSYGKDLAHPHRYLLNGGMVVRETDDSLKNAKGKQVFLASTMGQAGRGAFALNVGGQDMKTGEPIAASKTNNNNLSSEVMLFETAKGDKNTNRFGFTIGTPAIGRVHDGAGGDANDSNRLQKNIRQAVFVSNGYNFSEDYAATPKGGSNETALYVYEALGKDVGLESSLTTTGKASGALIQKLSVSNGIGGLSSPTLVDVDFDGVVDVVYAGDYGGSLYRFDVRNEDPRKWSVTRIFQTQKVDTTASTRQPITTAPAVSRIDKDKFVVIFGTGSDIYQTDLNNKSTQSVYGIYDDLTLNNNTGNTTVSTSGVATPAQDAEVKFTELLKQELRRPSGTSGYSYLTNNSFDKTKHRGWYFDLQSGNGERVVTKANMLLQTATLNTRTYEVVSNTSGSADDPCDVQTTQVKSSVYSWQLQFNALTGGALTPKDTYIQWEDGLNKSKDGVPAGKFYQGLLATTVVDQGNTRCNNNICANYAVTRDGDSGGSGLELPLNPNGNMRKNTCVASGNTIRVGNIGSSQGYSVAPVKAPICSALRAVRISWREMW